MEMELQKTMILPHEHEWIVIEFDGGYITMCSKCFCEKEKD